MSGLLAARRAGAGIAVGLACALCAQAQPLPRTPDEYLALMDRNGDRRISLGEYQDYLSRGFMQMDRDGDGRLSASELPAGARARSAPTLEGRRRALAAVFDRQDFNNDGFLDVRELAAPLQ